jgi:hypothetical protein
MSKMDLETEFHYAMKQGMREDFNPIEMDIPCKACKNYDELIDGEPWTWLDEKTQFCKKCYISMVNDMMPSCPYCTRGCADCLL